MKCPYCGENDIRYFSDKTTSTEALYVCFECGAQFTVINSYRRKGAMPRKASNLGGIDEQGKGKAVSQPLTKHKQRNMDLRERKGKNGN